MSKPDGGPAFPAQPRSMFTPIGGMSLRDWFAGQALAGLTQCQDTPKGHARYAYLMADAMLAEREK